MLLLAYDLIRSKQLKINYFLFAKGKAFFQAEVISTNSPDIGEVSLQITPILRLGDGLGNWSIITSELKVSNLLAISGMRVTPKPADTPYVQGL